MDTFMDKLAQKFTAQEMIKANAAAEAAELSRTREQVKKYDDCLAEMKLVNDDTREKLAEMENVLAAGMEQFKNAELPLGELTALIENSIEKIQELQANTEAVQDALKNHVDFVGNSITDFVHKENVKVYRNVQAVVVDELKKQSEELDAKLEGMSKTQRTTRNLAAAALIFSLLAAAALAAQLLIEFGIVYI